MADLTRDAIERRALALMERLVAHPGNTRFRDRLLRNEPGEVLARVHQLERTMVAVGTMPTEIPGMVGDTASTKVARFGPYRIVALIGRGGMGEVWRGERDDGLFEQTVAIKLIQPHLQIRAGDAFERERRFLAGLEHPGVARLIDGGATAEGRACLVMEFVDGVAFDEACAGQPIGSRIALIRQVLVAVRYAHGRLIAHGDLKPSNILVDRDGRVRLLDFGIARLLSEDADDLRLTGAVTSSFASPARLEGEPPSIPDDVFALGRLLGVVIAGAGDHELRAIAGKASAADELHRYTSVSEFLADLDRWEKRLPVRALRRTGIYVARKFCQRNWQAMVAAAALSGALLYAGASYLDAQRERAEAAARFDDARGTARYLLFTLYNELEARPGTLALRRQVAATAQHYLDRLARSPSTIPAVRLEAAQGLLRLSQVQGSPLLANLGQPDAAKANLAAAIGLLEPITSNAARHVAAEAQLDAADLAEMVEENQADAWRHLNAAKSLIDADPQTNALTWQKYFIFRSSIERWNVELPQARADALRALARVAPDTQLDALLMRARAYEMLSDAVDSMDLHAEAKVDYLKSLALGERAVALYPGSYYAHRRLAVELYHSAMMEVSWGDARRGLALIERAVREGQASVATEPDDDNARRSLVIDQIGRARALARLGSRDEAIGQIQRILEDSQASIARHPDEQRRIRDLAIYTSYLADMQARFRLFAAACASYRKSHQLFDQMGKLGHLSVMDRAATLAGIEKAQAQYCSGTMKIAD